MLDISRDCQSDFWQEEWGREHTRALPGPSFRTEFSGSPQCESAGSADSCTWSRGAARNHEEPVPPHKRASPRRLWCICFS